MSQEFGNFMKSKGIVHIVHNAHVVFKSDFNTAYKAFVLQKFFASGIGRCLGAGAALRTLWVY